jgi:beta-galactosidase
VVELAARGPYRFLINRTDRTVDVSAVAGADRTLPPRGVIVTGLAGADS